MRLSIITVAYNNLVGLRKTHDSLAIQGFKDFEWVVIDGGSDDGTHEYLSSVQPAPDHWVSERDRGIYDAMNKGIAASRGEFLLFLNSGDRLLDKNSLASVFARDLTADVTYGDLRFVYPDRTEIHRYAYELTQDTLVNLGIPHPAAFIRKTAIVACGGYDSSLQLVSDWKLWLQFYKDGRTFEHRSVVVSDFETGGASFVRLDQAKKERRKILNEMFGVALDPMKKHKILFVINQLNKGGAETSLVNFVRLIVKDGHEVSLVVYDHHKARNVVSLLDRLPGDVDLCVGNGTVITERLVHFVSDRRFDVAISVGEWHSPKLVMRYANATKKAIWVHADITAPSIPKASDLFDYDRETDAWICVSEYQCKRLRDCAPFLTGDCLAVHNPIDLPAVLEAAAEEVEPLPIPKSCKKVVMVGNFRKAKNYHRAVMTAAELRKSGCDAAWIICGDQNDREYVASVRELIAKNGLRDRFFLLGAVSNPWRYMSQADAFVSTSDSESWCMAITEALALGKPVIATSTGGASEQVVDGKNGYLCGFDPKLLAERLMSVLNGLSGLGKLKKGELFDSVAEFMRWVDSPTWVPDRPPVVFVIDDANFRGGAHIATARLIKRLYESGVRCDVFCAFPPSNETRTFFLPANIRHVELDHSMRMFFDSGFMEYVRLKGIPVRRKIEKLFLSTRRRLFRKVDGKLLDQCLNEDVRRLLCEYQTVVVLSESSQFRKLVSALPADIRKIQLCHTYYSLWRKSSLRSMEVCFNDRKIYSRMDAIGLIGKKNTQDFSLMYPELAERAVPFYNIIDFKNVQAEFHRSGNPIRLVTVSRLEADKDLFRLIRVAQQLKKLRLKFSWDVYGDGPQKCQLQDMIATCQLQDFVHIRGFVDNPMEKVKNADLLVLLSHYEGLPNVIYEALCVGTPVLATAVGGIPEQIVDGVTGKLVPDEDEAIVRALRNVIRSPSCVDAWRKALEGYQYDNDATLRDFIGILRCQIRDQVKSENGALT